MSTTEKAKDDLHKLKADIQNLVNEYEKKHESMNVSGEIVTVRYQSAEGLLETSFTRVRLRSTVETE